MSWERRFLERRLDVTDRRAKLIFLTPRGGTAVNDAGDPVAEIEQHWSQLVGQRRLYNACRTMQDLLDALT